MKRVVVTGIGLLTSIGINSEISWSNLLNCKSGIKKINSFISALKSNKKDHSGRRGLVILVSKRRKLLNYLRKNNIDSYKKIIKELNIRK